MLLNDNEMETITYTAYEYQTAIDRIKYIKGQLVELVNGDGTPEEKYFKLRDVLLGEYGVIDSLDRIVNDGMLYLETETISSLIDNIRAEAFHPFTVENRVMNPVSFYHNLKLVGIARNREAYLATLKQIGDRHIKGCQALVGEELIDITENGELAHEPKAGPVIPDDTMDYLHWNRGV
jgi:hypothetical protein